MRVSEQQMKSLFLELGYKTAGDWGPKRLAAMAARLPDKLGDDDPGLKISANKETLQEVLAALRRGEEVEVLRDGGDQPQHETNGHAEAKGGKKGAKAGKKKSAKSGNGAADLDELGARQGSGAALINAVLLKASGPLPLREIAAKVPEVKYPINQLRVLERKGLATRTKEGYALVGSARGGKKSKKSKKANAAAE